MFYNIYNGKYLKQYIHLTAVWYLSQTWEIFQSELPNLPISVLYFPIYIKLPAILICAQ